jgi:hypothetical protein
VLFSLRVTSIHDHRAFIEIRHALVLHVGGLGLCVPLLIIILLIADFGGVVVLQIRPDVVSELGRANDVIDDTDHKMHVVAR